MNENRSFSQTAIPLTISVLGLAALLYVLRDMVRIVLDPGVSVVTADELLSGAPVTHPRIIIEGACVHLDSAATGDWTTRGKGGTNRHSETVAPLRHAQTGQPLGWLLRVPEAGSGCAPQTIRGTRGAVGEITLAAARAAGLDPDPARVIARGWWERWQAAAVVLAACWIPGNFAFLLIHPFQGRTGVRVSRLAGISFVLSLLALLAFLSTSGITLLRS